MEQQHYLDPVQEKKLPGSINVLTILTFIGCGLTLVGNIIGFLNAKKSYDDMQKFANGDDVEKLPGFMRSMFSPEMVEVSRKNYENKLPILIIGVIASLLCIYGALEMRKLKSVGYWEWLAGELLPFLGTLLFVGLAAFNGFMWIGICIVAVFIILYTTQRKYLTK